MEPSTFTRDHITERIEKWKAERLIEDSDSWVTSADLVADYRAWSGNSRIGLPTVVRRLNAILVVRSRQFYVSAMPPYGGPNPPTGLRASGFEGWRLKP